MYSKIAVSLFFGVSVTLSDNHINSNDGDTRYMISQFNGDEFPIAIDTCNPLDITGGSGYQMAVCNEDSSLTWSQYVDDACTELGGVTFDLDATNQTGDGLYGDFNCDSDGTDSYAIIDFAIDSCNTGSFVSMHAAVGICALTGPYAAKAISLWVSIEVYCEKDFAELQYYDSSTTGAVATCTEDYLDEVANATNVCDFMLETSGTAVYGVITGCFIDDESLGASTIYYETEDYDDDDSVNRNQLSAVAFGLVMAFVSFHL